MDKSQVNHLSLPFPTIQIQKQIMQSLTYIGSFSCNPNVLNKVQIISGLKKSYKSEKFKKWFCDEEGLGPMNQLVDVKTRTGRFKKSPLPYLTELLNQNFR